MLPTVQVGTSRLVEGKALHTSLKRVHEAKDLKATSSVIEAARQEKQEVSRRKLRSLVQYDHTPVTFASLPSNLMIERGRVEVRFQTVEELAEAMYFLARVLEAEGKSSQEFERTPKVEGQNSSGTEELFNKFLQLETLRRMM